VENGSLFLSLAGWLDCLAMPAAGLTDASAASSMEVVLGAAVLPGMLSLGLLVNAKAQEDRKHYIQA
jgi:hypothetical protein